jgi:multiple sugar transport system permease protein
MRGRNIAATDRSIDRQDDETRVRPGRPAGPLGRAREWWSGKQMRVAPYVFIAPNLLLLTTFMFGPIVAAIVISFHEWNVIGTSQFTGLDNYARLSEDPLFRQALLNTGVYALGTVPTSMALGLGAAVLLNRRLAGRTFFRGVYFAPMVISGVATALIAAWLFNDNYGIINKILQTVGLQPVAWLSTSSGSMTAAIVATVWTRIGLSMVVYLAGLQAIPESLYDAAKFDGATAWQQFRFITLPMLTPTTFLLIVINVIFSFKAFDLVFAMTGGGPGFSTTLLVMYIYKSAFQNSEMGYASAMGVVLYVIVTLFMIVQWRLSKKAEDYG